MTWGFLALWMIVIFISILPKKLTQYLGSDYIPWAFWIVTSGAVLSGGITWYFSSAEVGALVFTAIYILWYSIETSKLVKATKEANHLASKTRDEMIMANQLSIQPGLVLEYKRGETAGLFELINIGKGGAINIHIESSNPEFVFKLGGINAIGAGDRAEIILSRISALQSYLSLDDLSPFGLDPLIATIYFERTKKLPWKLRTIIEVKNPPNIKILETHWVPN